MKELITQYPEVTSVAQPVPPLPMVQGFDTSGDQVYQQPANTEFIERTPQYTQFKNTDPFNITIRYDDTDVSWVPAQNGGSILDETNGSVVDLSSIDWGTPVAISATRWILLEADIDTDLVATGWALTAVAATDPDDRKEVGFDAGPPAVQNKLRLRLAKITFNSGIVTVTQACRTSQVITFGFVNGAYCKVFASHTANE